MRSKSYRLSCLSAVLRGGAVVAVIVAVGGFPASAAEGHFYLLGEDLFKSCIAGKKGWPDDLRIGTYAEAAADGQELYVTSGGSPKFCLADEAKRSDLVTALCDYLKANPGKRAFSGMAVTIEALAARYPCGR
jgi:hypothetical protein